MKWIVSSMAIPRATSATMEVLVFNDMANHPIRPKLISIGILFEIIAIRPPLIEKNITDMRMKITNIARPRLFICPLTIVSVEAFIKYLDGEEVTKKTFIPCAHYYYEDAENDESRVAEQW